MQKKYMSNDATYWCLNAHKLAMDGKQPRGLTTDAFHSHPINPTNPTWLPAHV